MKRYLIKVITVDGNRYLSIPISETDTEGVKELETLCHEAGEFIEAVEVMIHQNNSRVWFNTNHIRLVQVEEIEDEVNATGTPEQDFRDQR